MNAPAQPTQNAPKSNAWIGLLIGFGLLVLVVWANSRPMARSDKLVELTSANWEKEVVDSEIPVVVDFWATWCGPCRDFAPTIDKLADTYSGRVKFAKVNLDEAQDIVDKFAVTGIPQVMIFKRGKLAARLRTGIVPVKELTRSIDSVLSLQ